MSSPSNGIPRIPLTSAGYSSTVRLSLQANNRTHGMTQVGAGRLELDHPTTLESGPAEIVIEIDGDARTTPIQLGGSTDGGTNYSYVVRQ